MACLILHAARANMDVFDSVAATLPYVSAANMIGGLLLQTHASVKSSLTTLGKRVVENHIFAV